MGQYNLRRLLKPSRIAVVEADKEPGTFGNAVMANLIHGGFKGTLMPVNKVCGNLHDMTCYSRVEALEEEPDLVIVATPANDVPEVLRACAAKNAAGAMIMSDIFGEDEKEGRRLASEIKQISRDTGLRILGPRSLGIVCPGDKLNASVVPEMPPAGNLAFISQSNTISTAVLDLAKKEHFGFRHFISLGTMLDVDFDDIIDYLGNDGATKSILLYIENLTQVRKFMSAARSISRIKPIIALKPGKGADPEADAVYDAAFRRAGIVRVNTIQELFDCAELTAKQPRPMGTGLAVITNGSSPGVMVTDELYRSGQALAPLPEQVSAELDKILPASRGRTNPVCLAEDAAPQSVRDVLDVCVRATEIHGVLMALAPPPLSDPADLAEALLAALSGRSFPVIICLMGGARIAGAMAMLNQAGIPTYETPERAVKACLCLREYARNRAALTQIPPRMTRHLGINREIAVDLLGKPKDGEVMPDPDCRAVLTAYGMKVLPSALAETAKEAVEKAREMGFPLAMKLLSPDITHKIEAGGVKLGLRSEDEVREAFGQIMSSAAASQAAKGGVLIQPFMDQPDYEISLSSRQDPVFGPVIGFGPGGIFSEISRDRALGLPPMNRLLASHLIEATHVSEVLKGVRNRPPADVEQLQDLIIRLSQLMIDFPEIQELDMNPVLIKDTKAVLAGARLRVARTHIRSPHHLVISPYPAEYEKTVTAKDGSPILLRPVRPEDAPMFQEFYKVLSSKSLYYRFFTPIRELKPDMLARFTQIDYDREIALVAIAEEAGVEKMLGVARIMGDPDATTGEFAVMVGDPWHGKGIGGKILRYCLDIARDRKFKTVEGYVLAENSGMINLGKKMGFNVTRDGSEVVLKQTF